MSNPSGLESMMYNVSLNSGESASGEDTQKLPTNHHEAESNFIAMSDPDESPDEAAEKARLIGQVLELQNTLEDLSQRVDSVKEENLKLKSENEVLGKYIDNLMSSSSVFQQAGTKLKSKPK